MHPLERFGSLSLPTLAAPGRFVIFFPPAVGEQGMQKSEADALAARGAGALCYVPPHLAARRNGRGGSTDLSGELAIWRQAREEFADILGHLERAFGLRETMALLLTLAGVVLASRG